MKSINRGDTLLRAGVRVRYVGRDINHEYYGLEGEVVSAGEKTALIRFDGRYLKFHCSQERLERVQ